MGEDEAGRTGGSIGREEKEAEEDGDQSVGRGEIESNETRPSFALSRCAFGPSIGLGTRPRHSKGRRDETHTQNKTRQGRDTPLVLPRQTQTGPGRAPRPRPPPKGVDRQPGPGQNGHKASSLG